MSAGDLTTDPRAYFDSLSTEAQDATFGKAGAAAIRDGADIAQVVNARRGMDIASIGGRQVRITREGITRHGLAGQLDSVRRRRGIRLMPEQIYAIAGDDRGEAVRLLRSNGYVLDELTPPRHHAGGGGGGGGKPPVEPPAPPAGEPVPDPFENVPLASAATTRPDLGRLSEVEKEAVGYYTQAGAYLVNLALHRRMAPSASALRLIEALDSALGKFRLTETIRVNRVVSWKMFAAIDAPAQLPTLAGTVWPVLGYMSTTVDAEPLRDFFDDAGEKIVLQLVVPAGTPALFVRELSLALGENELIVARGRRLRVLDAYYDEHLGRWVVRAVVLEEQ